MRPKLAPLMSSNSEEWSTPQDNARLINQTSGEFEYYTPLDIIESARAVMGSIDLDPASSALANERVRATNYYDINTNGLVHQWNGNIWMNHPFGRIQNPLWIKKLMTEFQSHTIQFCCITFACTSEAWFQPLLRFPQCFLSPRTNYYLADGSLKKGVTKGSVVTYGGNRAESFEREFSRFGVVK